MTDCKHDRIQTWRIEDGTPAGLWSCVDCAVKFVPMSELEREKATPEAPQPAKREPLTREHVRDAGGIVHSDGNVFFTSLEHLNSAVESANGITGETK